MFYSSNCIEWLQSIIKNKEIEMKRQRKCPITCREVIERIKDILSTDGLLSPKDIDVAHALKISANTLAQRKFQDTIPYQHVLDFLHNKNISINQFFYGNDPMEVAKDSLKYKILKLYTANVSAGAGCENLDIEAQYILFDRAMLKRLGFEACDIVRVCGDSMEGIIGDGSFCFIETRNKTIKNGKIYAVNTRDGLFVKQCYCMDSNIMLVSMNEVYPPMQYTLEDIVVIGKVRGVINAL